MSTFFALLSSGSAAADAEGAPNRLLDPRVGSITLGALIGDVARRLNDPDFTIWTEAEIQRYLLEAYRLVAHGVRMFWDWTYIENLPRGFSYNHAWEKQFHLVTADHGFDYGPANYTYEWERDPYRLFGLPENEDLLQGPANHTSPSERGHLNAVNAAEGSIIPAVEDLPDDTVEIDRALWSRMALNALDHDDLDWRDSRYEITRGETHSYTWRKDGLLAFRKVRVPNEPATTYDIVGSWGVLRAPADLHGAAVTGSFGALRQTPAHHAFGYISWGLARRPYHDDNNVRVERWREGRAVVDEWDVFEVPDRYTVALRDYAVYRCLVRPGAGQDLQLSGVYQLKWNRAVSRLKVRVTAHRSARIGRFGGDPVRTGPPPRPRLPWQYGASVR